MKNQEPENAQEFEDEMPSEYDAATLKGLLKNGVRGKYVEHYRRGTNLVKLAPDVAAAFPTEQAVNEALRTLLESSRVSA